MAVAVAHLVLTVLEAVARGERPPVVQAPVHITRVEEQLDIPEVIPKRAPHIGVPLTRKEWLEALEPLTLEHRKRWAARHALHAELSLHMPGVDKHKGVDFKKFKKMRQNPNVKDDPFAQAMIDELELKAVADQLDVDIERPDERVLEMADSLAVRYDPRSHRGLKTGELKHKNGTVIGRQWHKSREKGQLERFDRVRSCGAELIVQHCGACAVRGPKIILTCDNHRLCLGCRDRRVKKFRKRFLQAQKAAMQMIWREGLAAPTRIEDGRPVRGGKWDQKFITLTLPHSGNVVKDVAELPKAWRRFWRLLVAHVVKDLLGGNRKDKVKLEEAKALAKFMRFCRVIEVTEGLAGDGHAHLHVWFLGPYIDQSRIADLWGQALSQSYQESLWQTAFDAIPRILDRDRDFEGCPCGKPHTIAVGVQGIDHAMDALRCRLMRNSMSAKAIESIVARERSFYCQRRGAIKSKARTWLWRPIVDVRACGPDIAEELCKYLVKDGSYVEGKLEMVAPHIYARIYAALEGRRAIAATLGLLTPLATKGCYCEHCGSTYKRWLESARMDAPRGPPGQQALPL
jgi:hypothetical protein